MSETITIQNPILPGFNPDPSICRVGDDFYIATSTFEWFPGVQIHHSKNLRDWELITCPLDRVSQLDMKGVQSSGGVWAPDLSFHDGLYYLIYTNVVFWKGAPFKDAHNYLVTAESLKGTWSEPIYLNSSGFDPSLFHDDDGKKYCINMLWDYRKHRSQFAGIILQEYSHTEKKLVGEVHMLTQGTELGSSEGPHIYKRNGWYYLLFAEGGTYYGHAECMARSRAITGPYEMHPDNPIVSALSKDERENELQEIKKYPRHSSTDTTLPEQWYGRPQKTGHASMCELKNDEWIMVYLMGRPLEGTMHCPLGRETGIQRVYWKDDWLYMHDAIPQNDIEIPLSVLPEGVSSAHVHTKNNSFIDNFDGERVHRNFQSLRVPMEKFILLQKRNGWIRIRGAESPVSLHDQAIIATRVQSINMIASTTIDIAPVSPQHFAGLCIRYNEDNQVLLRISQADNGEKTLGFMVFDDGQFSMPYIPNQEGIEISIPEGSIDLEVEMKINKNQRSIQFSWGSNGVKHLLPEIFDPAKFSDEYARPLGFTGMFVGIGCFDLSGARNYADFERFEYRET